MFICKINYPTGDVITIPPVEKLADLIPILNLSYATIRHISCGYYKGEAKRPRRIRHYLSAIEIEKTT